MGIVADEEGVRFKSLTCLAASAVLSAAPAVALAQCTLSPIGNSAVLMDLSADGDLDVVVGNWTAHTLTVSAANGPGAYGVPVVSGGWHAQGPSGLVYADVDLDGLGDLVYIADEQVYYMLQDASGLLLPPVAVPGSTVDPLMVRVADIDGSGLADLVIAARDPQHAVVVILDFAVGAYISPPFTVDQLSSNGWDALTFTEIADVDGDGDVDVVAVWVGSQMGDRGWYENDGYGVFSEFASFGLNDSTAEELLIADVDGDTILDVVDTHPDFGWYRGLGAGVFASKVNLSIVGAVDSIAVGDIDLNGYVDVVAS